MGSRLLKMITLFVLVAATVVSLLVAMQWKSDMKQIPKLAELEDDAQSGRPQGPIGAIHYVHKSGKGAKGVAKGGEAKGEPGQPSDGIAIVALDEMYVNVVGGESAHSLGMKLDLELFDEDDRALLEEREAAVRDTIITAARQQDYDRLTTLGGKLYFKEYLVSQINKYFREPVVRDVQFATFYMQ